MASIVATFETGWNHHYNTTPSIITPNEPATESIRDQNCQVKLAEATENRTRSNCYVVRCYTTELRRPLKQFYLIILIVYKNILLIIFKFYVYNSQFHNFIY